MRRRDFFRLLMIVFLVSALVQGPVTLLRVINPSRAWSLLTPIAFVVALEATFTTRWLVTRSPRLNRAAYRAAELLVLIVATRLITWAWSGESPAVSDLRSYLIQPTLVLDLTFVIYAILVFFAWDRSIAFSGIFTDLALTPAEKRYFTSSAADRSDIRSGTIVPRNRGLLMQRYLRQWVIGGLILAFFGTLTTFRLSELPEQGVLDLPNLARLGLGPEILAALLVYFLGGLWLASQARADVLEARWLIDGSEVDPGIARRWRRASPLLLLAIATIAAFLPIGSTFGISRIIQLAINLALVAIGAIVAVASLVLFTLASLFSGDAQEEPLPPIDFEASIPQFETSAATNDTAALITGSLFWVFFLLVAMLATIFFLRDRGVKLGASHISRFMSRFVAWLKELWITTTAKAQMATGAIVQRLHEARPGSGEADWSWPLGRIGRLSPREQIRFFYLAAVRRAGEAGIERTRSETPLEYALQLKDDLPELEEDVDTLTNAFLKARYSRESVAGREVAPIRDSWKRLRKALRKSLRPSG